MDSSDDRRDHVAPGPDYRTLPQVVRLDETIETVQTDPVPDPAAGRNLDHHAALRED